MNSQIETSFINVLYTWEAPCSDTVCKQ